MRSLVFRARGVRGFLKWQGLFVVMFEQSAIITHLTSQIHTPRHSWPFQIGPQDTKPSTSIAHYGTWLTTYICLPFQYWFTRLNNHGREWPCIPIFVTEGEIDRHCLGRYLCPFIHTHTHKMERVAHTGHASSNPIVFDSRVYVTVPLKLLYMYGHYPSRWLSFGCQRVLLQFLATLFLHQILSPKGVWYVWCH